MVSPYEPSPYTNNKPNIRICLKCNKEFNSLGPYNRVCNKCNVINSKFKASTVKDRRPNPKTTPE